MCSDNIRALIFIKLAIHTYVAKCQVSVIYALLFVFFLQSAVRAALLGRVLVVEGVEKAERNVLPVLINLLENRDMQLEDGRFILAAERYEKLLVVRT